MKAYVFPGQGAQFSGMGKDLYESNSEAKKMFGQANEILGFDITKIMFEGSDEDLKKTDVTQPAVFLHSVILALTNEEFAPDMVAGHSLGEFSALVASGALSFEDGLSLVSQRAKAMQKACEKNPSTMAAILGLEDEKVEEICKDINGVVAANFNCPGQVVISGTNAGIDEAIVKFTDAGAKRALKLPVGGGFHSPMMEPARAELADAIASTNFVAPKCAIYQNVDANATKDVSVIKENLIAQLTAPVRWTQTVKNMMADGVELFVESGPGKVLQGLVKKVDRKMPTQSI